MVTSDNIYEYYNGNQLGVNQDVFDYLNIKAATVRQWIVRGKLNRLRTAGRGRTGLIAWSSIPDEFLAKIKAAFGDPYRKDDVDSFVSRLNNDDKAAVFFMKAGLSPLKEYQHYIEAQILNLYGELLQEIEVKAARNTSFKKTQAKRELAKVIADLKTLKREDGKAKFPHKLPSNPRSLERRYKEYAEQGYERLIHAGTGNDNRAKITGSIGDFLNARYSMPNKPSILDVWTRYEAIRNSKKWPKITEDAIYKFLMRPENEKIWYLGRHGHAAWKVKFAHKIVRDKSDWFPNVYLAIDGTKLDWKHLKKSSSDGTGADIKVNVVFDVYSEKIIAAYFGLEHENHMIHFTTWKQAFQTAGVRPLKITYDGQGGHTTKVMQELYDSLVDQQDGEHYKHRAREHGSPVEQLFSRWQQQILNTRWNSDKQGVRTRKMDSRPNAEFIMRNKEHLKEWYEYEPYFRAEIERWNNSKHPHFEGTRNEVYPQEAKYELEQLGTLDMMNLFWITGKDPVTYYNYGLKTEIVNTKYHFEVYDDTGAVDIDFRDKYTGCKFYVSYDPDLLDQYVRLYLKLPNGDTRYIADAQPVKKVKEIEPLMDDHDRNRKHKMMGVRDEELSRVEAMLEKIRHTSGVNEETLIDEQEDVEWALKSASVQPKRTMNHAEAYHSKY